jgi:transposase InsO family protein
VQGGGDLRAELQDECLKQEIFPSLREAQIVISRWQNTYNRVRPHSSLGYRPPAPVTLPDVASQVPMLATMQ